MTWTTPLTVATNDILTAAQYNLAVRDNFLEMAPAKATATGNFFSVTAANQVDERRIGSDTVTASESTSSTSYTDLATVGPSVTVPNCSAAIVFVSARMSNDNGGAGAWVSVAVSGATSRPASDDWMIGMGGLTAANPARFAASTYFALTPGSNTFTVKYKSQAGETPSRFEHREIVVVPL